MRSLKRRAFIVLAATWALGCRRESSAKPKSTAQFGVFFGGQIQERTEIPFVVDRSKQTHGFRIEFSQPPTVDQPVRWELDMPASSKRVRNDRGRRGSGRLTRVGDGQARAGQKRYEQVMNFEPGDPLGVWNIRVSVGTTPVLDQSFLVFNPAKRKP